MTYPASDHYDGKHFFNPEPAIRTPPPGTAKQRSVASFIFARLRKDPNVWTPWPEHIENKTYPPPSLPASVTFIGHSSFLVRLPGLTFLTDPVFAERCSPTQLLGPKRVRAPGIALKALPPIDLVLLSHNHYDHMDLTALRALRRRNPAMNIVTSLGNAAYLASKGLAGVVELDWWQSADLGATKITATPARHFAARTLWDRNETLWCGFYLEHAGHCIYFAGDSGYTKSFKEIGARLGPADLGLLPIGAYEPRWFMGAVHMNPADAVQAFVDLGAKRAIGMHFGTFQLTAEAIDAPVRDLAAARTAAGILEDAFGVLDVGESRGI
jgi:L-ascorbate metabolism protein UlaG (beta-lactamase superfamily)